VKILILGGTAFLGRHFAELALEQGHELTLFHRGRTNPDLFPDVETRVGDRNEDLSALESGEWDAVVDTSGYLPVGVEASAKLLEGRVSRYLFVSTVSVYTDFGGPGDAGGSEILELEDPDHAEQAPENYGPLKRACERRVESAYGSRSLIIRPGLIVGPNDPSDRFTYWPERCAQGGEILAPAPKDRLVQMIDVRDLALFMLEGLEAERDGIFDATGPVHALTMGETLQACLAVAGGDGQFTWVDTEFLVEQEVGPWMELPLWVPDVDVSIDLAPAIAAGLRCRGVEETARDTLAWAKTLPADRETKTGLAPKREAELLAAWGERAKA
jgi:2'-hydroxyisoflavone reductase